MTHDNLRTAFAFLREAARKPIDVSLYTKIRDALMGRGIDTDRILRENNIPKPM